MQDSSEEALAEGRKRDLSRIEGRVSFVKHNLFEDQPVRDAGAYFLRHVVHNWNDEDCVRIFKALVPALENCKPGTPVLLNDIVMPTPGSQSAFEERYIRELDTQMLMLLGSKQRTAHQFNELLQQADERLHVAKVHGEGRLGMIEAQLKT